MCRDRRKAEYKEVASLLSSSGSSFGSEQQAGLSDMCSGLHGGWSQRRKWASGNFFFFVKEKNAMTCQKLVDVPQETLGKLREIGLDAMSFQLMKGALLQHSTTNWECVLSAFTSATKWSRCSGSLTCLTSWRAFGVAAWPRQVAAWQNGTTPTTPTRGRRSCQVLSWKTRSSVALGSKWKASVSAQMLSHSVAAGISICVQSKRLEKRAEEEVFSDLFVILESKHMWGEPCSDKLWRQTHQCESPEIRVCHGFYHGLSWTVHFGSWKGCSAKQSFDLCTGRKRF